MDFERAVGILNRLLLEENPESFNASWIIARAPAVYRYIHKNVRTEHDEIDWDSVTRELDWDFQKRWAGRWRRNREPYESQAEVDVIFKKYQDKIYIFIASQNKEDRQLRDKIIVPLVRIAQRGNALALQQALTLIRYTVDDWVERFFVLNRWSSYSEELDEQLAACVRRYRFTGSFFGYVFKTLEYRGRGLQYMQSLDRETFTGRSLSESVVQDPDTGEARLYRKDMSFSPEATP
jgi:hypothetical protein